MKDRKIMLLNLLIISCLLMFGVSCAPKAKSVTNDAMTCTPATTTPATTTPATTTPATTTPAATTPAATTPATTSPVTTTPAATTPATTSPATTTPAPTPPQTNTHQTFTGIIIDEDCLVKYPNPGNDLGEDTKICLQMKSCAASGYGIAVLQSDNTYRFYYFDGTIAQYDSTTKVLTPGTGAQLDSWNLVHATTKKDHVTVSVTGTLSGKTEVSPYDGIRYSVIRVSSLSEN